MVLKCLLTLSLEESCKERLWQVVAILGAMCRDLETDSLNYIG